MTHLGDPAKTAPAAKTRPVGSAAGGFSEEGRQAIEDADWGPTSPADLIGTVYDVATHPGAVAGFVASEASGAILEGVRELLLGPVAEVFLTIVLALVGLGLVAFAVAALALRTGPGRAVTRGG